MNRSILIVICDFLLLSLLFFSSPDLNKAGEEGAALQVKSEISTNQPDSGKDLAAAMRQALDEERKNREQLVSELTRTREVAGEKEKQAQGLQQSLQAREQETQRFQAERAALQQQFAAAQTNLLALNQQLQATSSEATLSKEKLASMEAEIKKRADEAAALQEKLARAARSNEVAIAEKQQLAGALKVAETEKRFAVEQATRMEGEVKTEREEKAKLAEGVKALASRSGELAQEVRENRPLAANTIFSEFTANQVQAMFSATRPGLLGLDSNKHKDTQTVLVSDGTNTFALCHVQDTPLSFWNPGTEWESLTGTLSHNTEIVPIRSLSFYWSDPRLILMPVTPEDVRRLGSKPYRISKTPFKFPDAVLVGAREGYYGECRFQIDVSTPEYVKLDRSFLKGLFGKFNPSRGDLVFSKTGELLGVMANGTYCTMLRNFDSSASFQFGQDVRAQHTGEVLARFYSMVAELPMKLQ
jgi:hypothetical protein